MTNNKIKEHNQHIDDSTLLSKGARVGDSTLLSKAAPVDDPTLLSKGARVDESTLLSRGAFVDDSTLLSKAAPVDDSTLLSIKDFSRIAKQKQSALRYYDKIGLFSPSARGENNYRYYTPFQLLMLNFINVLADLGIPLTSIKELSDNRAPESIIELLGRQEIKLDRQMHQLRTAYSIIHTFRSNIQKGLSAREDDVSVEEQDEFYIIKGPVNHFQENGTFYEPFINFLNSADKNRINLHYPIGGYHHNMDAFIDGPGQPTKFFSLDPFGDFQCPAGRYLVGYARGYYGEFGDLPQRMIEYAQEHRLRFQGAVYSLYLLDEISIVNPDQYLARVAVSVAKK